MLYAWKACNKEISNWVSRIAIYDPEIIFPIDKKTGINEARYLLKGC